jgi:hypothetical protein
MSYRPNDNDIGHTTMHCIGVLRILKRGEERIFQQLWRVDYFSHTGRANGQDTEWRDIEVIEEAAPMTTPTNPPEKAP